MSIITATSQRENHTMLDLEKLYEALAIHQQTYQNDQPYPHIVLDDFLHPAIARQSMEAFPPVNDTGWIHYLHVNEKKHGLNKMELLPKAIQELIHVLHTPEFINWLSELTGIDHLHADDSLEGGGLHQTETDGYLNIHADFTVHPHKRNWRRRVNLLIYLNENWKEVYNGHLELWSTDMKRCVQKISPTFNRCVIFNTDQDSYHGVPEPLACPGGMTRKSLALYYYTEEKELPLKRATNYRARPGDGLKALWIYLDTKALALYNDLKGRLGLKDDFASRILSFFNRKRRP